MEMEAEVKQLQEIVVNLANIVHANQEALAELRDILFESAIDIADETRDYEYLDPKTGATCIDSGIVACAKVVGVPSSE